MLHLPHASSSVLASTIALAIAPGLARAQSVQVVGALTAGQPVVLRMTGTSTYAEAGTPNPFTDRRLDVTITPAETGIPVVVPGYFAADGDAAASHATSGSVWEVRFTPRHAGDHRYEIRFLQGPGVAVDEVAGTSGGEFDGMSGVFTVAARNTSAPGFYALGRLAYDGTRYPRFDSGDRFLRNGAGSPENLLAYDGFDNTVDKHSYDPHDLDIGLPGPTPPTWSSEDAGGDDSSDIVGAMRYLGSQGVNSFYFLTMNMLGDGRDVIPWIDETNRLTMDVSKLAQWNLLFTHMQELGIELDLYLQETENERLAAVWGTAPDTLTAIRRLYYREMVARFGHHNAVTWNLCEESTRLPQYVFADAVYLSALDAHDHPIALHTFPNEHDQRFEPLLGHPRMTSAALQILPCDDDDPDLRIDLFHDTALTWVERSEDAEQPWIVAIDEIGCYTSGVHPDGALGTQNNQHEVRKYVVWGGLMAGAAGNAHYFGYSFANNDLDCEDFRSRSDFWPGSAMAVAMFQGLLPFARMASRDDLVQSASTAYCLAQPGAHYAVYLPAGGAASVQLGPANYSLEWFDPLTGAALGAATTVAGTGGFVALGNAPATTDGDALARLTVQASANQAPTVTVSQFERVAAGDSVALAASIANPDGPIQVVTWDFGDGVRGVGPTPTHVYRCPGVYAATVTVDDGIAQVAATVEIAVGTAHVAATAFGNGTLEGFVTNGDDFTVQSGAVQASTGIGNLTWVGPDNLDRDPILADVTVEIRDATVQGSGWLAVIARKPYAGSPSLDGGYMAYVRSASGGTQGSLRLRRNGDTPVTFGPTSLPFDVSVTPFTLRLEVDGDALTAIVEQGGQTWSVAAVDAAFDQPGYCAVARHDAGCAFAELKVSSLADQRDWTWGELHPQGRRAELRLVSDPLPNATVQIEATGLPANTQSLMFAGPDGVALLPALQGTFGVHWYLWPTGNLARIGPIQADASGNATFSVALPASGTLHAQVVFRSTQSDGLSWSEPLQIVVR